MVIVLSKKEKSEIYGRIEAAMQKIPGMSRVRLSQELKKIGHGLSIKSLSDYSAGKAAPGAETLIGLSKVLHVSPGYILTGEEQSPELTLEDLTGKIYEMLKATPSRLSGLDKETMELVDIIIDLDKDGRQALLPIARRIIKRES